MNNAKLYRAIRPSASLLYPGPSNRQFRRAGALAAAFTVFFPLVPPIAGAENDEKAEIKLLVQSDKIAEAKTGLKLADTADKRYKIHFVDTAKFDLIDAGLILRLRDKGDGKTETTVKFRPPKGSKPPNGKWEEKLEKEIEWLIRKGENVSYSLKHVIKGTDLLEKPDENLAALFSDDQKALFEEIRKAPFAPGTLKVYGPIEADIWEWEDKDVGDKVSAELWNLAGKQILEVSRKSKAKKLETKANEFEAAFKERVAIDPDPESKTRRALGFLKGP
jgi:hypothetical protein